MKLQFEIVPVELGDSGALYSIRYKGERRKREVIAQSEYRRLIIMVTKMNKAA